MKKILLVEIISSLLVAFFTYAALSKFQEHQKYLASELGWFFPSVEALIVILFFLDRTRMIGLLASLTLLSLFEIYISTMLLSEKHFPYSYSEFISGMSSIQYLGLNASFILLIILAISQHQKFRNAIGIDQHILQNFSRA